MHLHVAEQIRAHPALAGPARDQVIGHFPAFYLGSVAPDVQTISGVPREATHFYTLPPQAEAQAHETMLAHYPELAAVDRLPPDQAVFIAAYSAHLMLDLRWYWEVLLPYFAQSPGWLDHRQRFLAHNTLLTYLDTLALASLPATAGATLAAAEPDNWLPFAGDADLIRWQEMLVAQLQPGAPIHTVQIYAGRLSMSPDDFAAHLAEPAWMEEQIFGKAPLDQVQAMLHSAVDESVDLIHRYLTSDGSTT